MPGERVDHRLWRMAEAEHAVAADVVHDRALERDHPRPARSERDIGVDRIAVVEIDEVGLHARELRGFVKLEQIGKFVGEIAEQRMRLVDRSDQVRVVLRETFDRRIGQSLRARFATAAAQFIEFGDRRHGELPRL